MAPPNPRYTELEQALVEIKERVAKLEAALDDPHRQFTGQQVWVGPTARRFASDLTERRNRLRAAGEAVIAELEAELRATPAG